MPFTRSHSTVHVIYPLLGVRIFRGTSVIRTIGGAILISIINFLWAQGSRLKGSQQTLLRSNGRKGLDNETKGFSTWPWVATTLQVEDGKGLSSSTNVGGGISQKESLLTIGYLFMYTIEHAGFEVVSNITHREKEMDSLGTCAALALGALPLFIWLVWSWNEVRFLLPLKLRSNGANLPPGHMGLPLLGEMLSFLWYFKIVRRPDDFILSKRKRYGRGVGLYRTHLFGSPSIIACEPSINKFILQSDNLFAVNWPSVEIVGRHSLVAVNGAPHSRVRTFVVNALNKPEALKQITLAVQPRLISSLHHWAQKARIKASDEITKVTFENICKMFVSLDPGPLVVDINKSIEGLVAGIRVQPFNFPGTAYHRALQCRNKLTEEFRRMLEARKKRETIASDEEMNDLMDGLRQIRDEEGKQLGDEEVLDNIISLVIAGYKSTSIATMWSLYYLCKYPSVLRQLRAENMEIRERKKGDGDFLTMDDISEMKYTRKVVEETIRIANISPTIFRRANEDVDYQGYRIPKDWQVIVWIRHLHTDPDNFQDPFHFNPDRWDTSPKPGTYQVFGGGSRICAGNMLVRIQLSIFLHHLTTGYRWELVNPDAKIAYLPHPKPADGAEMTFHAL